jgi:anti-anti-sigma regulatory factor
MMNTSKANLLVLVGEQFACVKVAGRANFATAVDFKTVLTELENKGFPYLVIELSECPLMDSTFLGVLAATGIRMNPANVDCVKQAIELRNANERLLELLENLGVLHLFKTCNGELPRCEQIDSSPCQPTREALTRASLEAHQTLMQINPDNVARFKDVTKFLAEDLERLKGNSSNQN